jgi:hypothetical protein
MGLKMPAITDKVQDTITDLAANFAIIDALYPVGSIYMSTKSTNPSTFIGGTWAALEGRFLVGAGSEYAAGSTGGEKTHTLTIDEMPSHDHKLHISGQSGSDQYGLKFVDEGTAAYTNSQYINYTGGGKAHNNLPPYKAVYMWERTA